MKKVVYEDSKYFEIIQVVYSGEETVVDEIFYEIPKLSYERKDIACLDFIEHKIQKNKEIIRNVKKSNSDSNKVETLESKNFNLERLL